MNKRLVLVGMLVVFVVTSLTALDSFAKDNDKAHLKRRAAISQARAGLEGKAYTIYMTQQPLATSSKKFRATKETDTLTFSKRRVVSSMLVRLGFKETGSNYSVRYETDGTLVWETMAKHQDGEGMAMLRGDTRNGIMTGVVDIMPARGARSLYYFTTMSPAEREAKKMAQEVKEVSKKSKK